MEGALLGALLLQALLDRIVALVHPLGDLVADALLLKLERLLDALAWEIGWRSGGDWVEIGRAPRRSVEIRGR